MYPMRPKSQTASGELWGVAGGELGGKTNVDAINEVKAYSNGKTTPRNNSFVQE